jgi:hypothetical protein
MLYLYHATYSIYLDSILAKGLLARPSSTNWKGMAMFDGVYLALDSEAAISYAETSDFLDEYDGAEDIEVVLLKIPLSALDETKFQYDWNNLCEYHTDINSCIYNKNIPASVISVVNNPGGEPYQDIDSFEGTYLYEVLLDTFDYEVETNMENGEDDE